MPNDVSRQHKSMEINYPQMKWLRYLVEPSPAIQDEDQRLRISFFSGLLVVATAFSVVVTLLSVDWQHSKPFLLNNFVVTIFMLLAYFFSRTRYYQLGAVFAVIIIFASVLWSITIDQSIFNVSTSVIFLSAAVLLSSILLRARNTVFVAVATIVACIFIDAITPRLSFYDFVIPLAYLTIVNIIIVTLVVIREVYIHMLERRTREISESALRYSTLFESASDAILIIDHNGKYVEVNSRASEMFGYTNDEFMHMNTMSLILPQNADSNVDVMQHLLAGETVYTEDQLRCKDGSIIDVQVSTKMLPDGNIQGIFRDITERKKAEETLSATRERLKIVVQNLPVMLFAFDPEGHITLLQSKGLEALGFKIDSDVSLSFFDLFGNHPSTIDIVKSVLNGEYVAQEMTVHEITLEVFINPLIDHNGQVVGATGIAMDVTERNRAKQHEMAFMFEKEKSTMLEHVIDDISHDLRNPLASMKTSVYLADKLIDDSEKVQRHLHAIDMQINHMENVLKELVEVSQWDKITTSDFNLARLDLNTLVSQVVQEQEALAAHKNHTLRVDTALNLQPVFGDSTKLKRALNNLVVNALNYTPNGGEICVKTFAENGEIAVEVRDNGVGINEADLPHIFERLYRADKARNMNKGGTGLGLAIVKKIVETHAGRVQVQSKIGEGSTFTVWLPIHPRAGKDED